MTEENKENLNQIPVGNPFDLVDKKSSETTSQNQTDELPWKFFKNLIKKIAKVSGLPDPETGKFDQDTQKNQNNSNTNPINNTDNTQNPVNTQSSLEQDIVAQEEQKKQEEEKKKFNFENVMSGVSGVLDKIEKKVWEKTGIDFDAPLKKREQKLNNENANTWQINTQTIQSTQPTDTQTTNPEIDKDPVEKNNEDYLSQNH